MPLPADEDERKHAGRLLEAAAVETGKAGRPGKSVRRLAADKGYDADALRNFLKKKGMQEKNEGGQCASARHDFKPDEPSHGCKESSGA